MNSVSSFVIIVAVLLLLGALGEWVFRKTGIPDVVWLMLSGVLAGPVMGIVSADLLKPAVPYFGAIALIVILAGGGFLLQLREVAEAAPRALKLAVLGVLFSMLAMVVFFYITTRLGWVQPASRLSWIMVGAIVGGSSSVVIMPTMAGGKAHSHIARLLEVESTATDTLCIIVTMVVIDLILNDTMDISRPLLALARELGFGLGVGVLAGMALLPLVPVVRGIQHGYTIFLSTMFLIYGVLQIIGGNGAMGVLSCALVLGNAPSIMKRLVPSVQEFKFVRADSAVFIHRQISFMIKAFFFFLIGLMFPADLRIILRGGGGFSVTVPHSSHRAEPDRCRVYPEGKNVGHGCHSARDRGRGAFGIAAAVRHSACGKLVARYLFSYFVQCAYFFHRVCNPATNG